MATIGVLLARERLSLLLAVPFTRLVFGPIRTMLLYRTFFRAIRGSFAGSVWNTARTASVQYGRPTTIKQAPRSVPVTVDPEEVVNA